MDARLVSGKNHTPPQPLEPQWGMYGDGEENCIVNFHVYSMARKALWHPPFLPIYQTTNGIALGNK